jgi:hypothetical protein
MMKAAFLLLLSAHFLTAGGITCFQVKAWPATANDNGRYLLESVSRCSGYVPSMYLRLRFELRDGTHVDTFESFRHIAPGRRWFQFEYPREAAGFVRVVVLGVVSELSEAMK